MSYSVSEHVACLVCKGATVPWITVPGDWRRPDHSTKYFLRWCDPCRFGQMDPRPDRNEISSFYNVSTYYTHHDAGVDLVPASLTLLERARIKVAWLCDHGVDMDDSWAARHLKPRAKVCDLGCGNGDLLSRLQRLGHEVVGIEPDPDASGVARLQGVRVVQGTAEDLPEEVEKQRFDCVIMSHVLEHVRDPLRREQCHTIA